MKSAIRCGIVFTILFAISVSLFIPAQAKNVPTSFTGNASTITPLKDFGIESINTHSDVEISNAYIDFSDQLFDMGLSPTICYEDFEKGYKSSSLPAQSYIDLMINAENRAYKQQNTEQKIVDEHYYQLLKESELSGLSAEENTLVEEYGELLDFFDDNEMNVFLPFDIFSESYIAAGCENISQYIDSVLHIDTTKNYSARSGEGEWYDNIGSSAPKLPQPASYSEHGYLLNVKKGYIISENSGGVATLTGHVGIVQGKYWDSTYRQYYIRVIESNLSGVVYGVLEDTRYDYRDVDIYASDATDEQVNNAVSFCLAQLGKPYNLSGVVGNIGRVTYCSFLKTSSVWYCSELVWAAFYNEAKGININPVGFGVPVNPLHPKILVSGSKVSKIYFAIKQ